MSNSSGELEQPSATGEASTSVHPTESSSEGSLAEIDPGPAGLELRSDEIAAACFTIVEPAGINTYNTTITESRPQYIIVSSDGVDMEINVHAVDFELLNFNETAPANFVFWMHQEGQSLYDRLDLNIAFKPDVDSTEWTVTESNVETDSESKPVPEARVSRTNDGYQITMPGVGEMLHEVSAGNYLELRAADIGHFGTICATGAIGLAEQNPALHDAGVLRCYKTEPTTFHYENGELLTYRMKDSENVEVTRSDIDPEIEMQWADDLRTEGHQIPLPAGESVIVPRKSVDDLDAPGSGNYLNVNQTDGDLFCTSSWIPNPWIKDPA